MNDTFQKHESALKARVDDFKAALSQTRQELQQARQDAGGWQAAPTQKGRQRALESASNAQALETLLKPFESPREEADIERAINDFYAAENLESLCKLLEAELETRLKPREQFRKGTAKRIGELMERLVLEDSMHPDERRRLDTEAANLESELLHREELLAAAKRAIKTLKETKKHSDFLSAQELTRNISYPLAHPRPS